MARELDATNRELQEIVDGHLLGLAGLMLGGGGLSDRFGRRLVLVAAFVAGSATHSPPSPTPGALSRSGR